MRGMKWSWILPEPVELAAEVRHEASRLEGAARARGLKLEFTVAPFADPSVIRMQYAGTTGAHVDAQGALVLGQR